MRYHNITKDDMLNGDGLRVVLWVAGCEHHCPNCQNPVTWDINGGLEFDEAAKKEIFDELEKNPNFKPYKAYANFILVEILKEGVTSFDVFEKAIKNQLMIRDCSSFESLAGEFFRFCIMNPADNRRLLDILNQI